MAETSCLRMGLHRQLQLPADGRQVATDKATCQTGGSVLLAYRAIVREEEWVAGAMIQYDVDEHVAQRYGRHDTVFDEHEKQQRHKTQIIDKCVQQRVH